MLTLFKKGSSRWLLGQEPQASEHQKSSLSVPTKEQVGLSVHWHMMYKHIIFTHLSLLPLSDLLYCSHRRVVSWCDPALTAQRPLPFLQSQWWPDCPHSDHDHTRLKRDYPGCQGIWCVVVTLSCADWALCFLLVLQCFTTDPHCRTWNQQGSLGFITYLKVEILRGKECV